MSSIRSDQELFNSDLCVISQRLCIHQVMILCDRSKRSALAEKRILRTMSGRITKSESALNDDSRRAKEVWTWWKRELKRLKLLRCRRRVAYVMHAVNSSRGQCCGALLIRTPTRVTERISPYPGHTFLLSMTITTLRGLSN